jgi:hypothetical protein
MTFSSNYKMRNSIPLYGSLLLVFASIFYIASGNQTDPFYLFFTLFLMPFLVYFSTLLLVQNIDTNEIIFSIEKLVKIFIVFLVIDNIVRFGYTYYILRSTGSLLKSFYTFKFSPITAGDTNFLALRILYPMCLLLFIEAYTHDKKWNKYIKLFFLFIILTLSRAAIVTATLLLIIKHLISIIKHKYYVLLFIEMLTGIFFVFVVFAFLFKNDTSFMTKIEIFESLHKIHEVSLNNALFGFGINEGRFAYSYEKNAFGHSHLALIIGQFGILGLILYIIFFTGLYYKTKGGAFYLIFAFFVSGFSLIDLGPNLFWVMGLMAVLGKRRVSHETTICI